MRLFGWLYGQLTIDAILQFIGDAKDCGEFRSLSAARETAAK